MTSRLPLLLLLLLLSSSVVAESTPPECEGGRQTAQCLAAMAAQNRYDNNNNIDHNNMIDEAKERELMGFVRPWRVFERLVNEWTCSVSGFPLYAVPNERDTFDFMLKILASAFKIKGQLYGAAMLKYFIIKVEPPYYNCDNIPVLDSSKYGQVPEALVYLKDALSQWLRGNEVDDTEILDFFVAQARELLGSWAVGHLLMINKEVAELTTRVLPEAVALGVVPLIESEGMEKTQCNAGADLWVLYRHTDGNDAIKAKYNKYLSVCLSYGRTAKKPHEFANPLLNTGREAEGRELLDIAVQRGQLCHARQRPSSHHRRDITARSIWGLEAMPPDVIAALSTLREAISKSVERRQFPFSHDTDSFSMFLHDGKWERTLLTGYYGINKTTCHAMGPTACEALERFVETTIETNDAYSFMCNNTLTVTVWRVQPGASTLFGQSPANINLQVLMPIAMRGTALLVQVGEEAVKLRDGDHVVVDDSFENRLTFIDEAKEEEFEPLEMKSFTNVDLGAKRLDSVPYDMEHGAVVLQVQLCHPELHDLAMEVPSSKCALPALEGEEKKEEEKEE